MRLPSCVTIGATLELCSSVRCTLEDKSQYVVRARQQCSYDCRGRAPQEEEYESVAGPTRSEKQDRNGAFSILALLVACFNQHAAVQAFDLGTRRSFVDGAASSLLTGAVAAAGMDPLPSPLASPPLFRPGGTARYNPRTLLANNGRDDSASSSIAQQLSFGNGMIATKLGQSRILAKELSPL